MTFRTRVFCKNQRNEEQIVNPSHVVRVCSHAPNKNDEHSAKSCFIQLSTGEWLHAEETVGDIETKMRALGKEYTVV